MSIIPCACDPAGCSPLTCKCEHHNPNQCAHGQLARSCEVCESDAIHEMQAETILALEKRMIAAEQRAEAAEAGAAALREALEVAYQHLDRYGVAESRIPNDPLIPSQERVFAAYHAAKKTDAGAAMLERLRMAEDDAKRTREECNSWIATCALAGPQAFHRLLRAAQSLHRAWKQEHGIADSAVSACAFNITDSAVMMGKLEFERDALREAAASVLHFLCVDSYDDCDDGREYLTIGAITDNREGGQVERVKALRALVDAAKEPAP